MSNFFASLQESAAALLRRCFIASQASASHLLKVALQRLFCADWFQELKSAADETSVPFINKKPDGPWDVYTVFDVLQSLLPRLLEHCGWMSSADPQRLRKCDALVRHVQYVYSTRNWWAHRPVSIEEACTACESLGDTLTALRLMLGSHASGADDCTSDVQDTLKLLRSASATVKWQVDDVAFVMLLRGFSALCEGAHAMVWECRKLRPDYNHVVSCHLCRQQLCQCTSLNAAEVKRGVKDAEVTAHLTGSSCVCAKTCAELVQNCLHDVGALMNHVKRCRVCMPSAPDSELEVVRTTRNLMFHGSKKELVSLVLSTLMCIEVSMERMRCSSKHDKVTMQGKAKSVQDMREQLQAFAQFGDVPLMLGAAAAAVRSQVDFSKCASVPNASALSDLDVVKHVLFGSVPLPASSCSCFKDMTKWLKSGNLGIVKGVLKDLSCVSHAAYTEVSTAVPRSTSLVEVSEKLHSRFDCNAAKLAALVASSAPKNAVDAACKTVDNDVKFCQELQKIAGGSPSPAVPPSAADIESLLSRAGEHAWKADAPLCAFAQSLHSKGHHWLLLLHVVFSGEASDGCSCLKDVSKSLKSGNLGIVKSVLKDPSCVSRAAYTEVCTSTAAPGSTSLAEVSGKLQCRFACNAAAVDGSKAVASDVKFCQELEKIAGAAPSPAVPSSAADIASLLNSVGQQVWNAGAPLCAFAQDLGSQGHYWLLLQHVVFSGEASDGVADCDCVVKQDSKDARLVYVKEKLKPWKGKTLADALPLVATAAVHLAELAQVHDAASTSSHAAVCVHLPDSSVDSKFLPIKLDPLLVARRALIDRCCSMMWAGVKAPGKRQLLLLHGISGVGKTCAAVAAIYQLQRLAKDAKCTMLIQLMSGHSAAAVRGEFVKFGRALSRRLKLDESSKDDDVILKLTAHLKDTRYAIFADDANEEGLKELMKLLPVSSEGCTIIVTSRLMNEGHGKRVAAGAAVSEFLDEAVACFSGSDAMDCLRVCEVDAVFLSHPDVPGLLEQRLGHLPFAVRVFATWLRNQDASSGASAALGRWTTMQDRVLQEGLPAHIRAVVGTVRLALDDLRREEGSVYVEAGLQLLGMLTMCPPMGVSWSLFDGRGLSPAAASVCSELQHEDGLCAVALHLQQCTGLVQVDVGQRLFSMHVLAQDALFAELSSQQLATPVASTAGDGIGLQAIKLLDWLLEGSGAAGARIVTLVQRICVNEPNKEFLPLYNDASGTCAQVLGVLVERQIKRGCALTSDTLKPFCLIREQTASCLAWIGELQQAMSLRRAIFDDAVRLLPPKDGYIAECMRMLAHSYINLGMYHEALPLSKNSLAMLQEILPEEHKDITVAKSDVASVYQRLDMHSDALQLNIAILATLGSVQPQATLGSVQPQDHEFGAVVKMHIASSYAALNNHSEALKLRQEALALLQSNSQNRRLIATSMNNLATSYHSLGQHSEALKLRKETLAIVQEIMPEGHIDIALIMHNLASSYHFLGEHSDALKLRKEALAIWQSILPEGHEDIALGISELATSYHSLGVHYRNDALQLYFVTLKASFHCLGEMHHVYWARSSFVIQQICELPGHQHLAFDLMFRLLCLMSAADDRVLVLSQLYNILLYLPIGQMVTCGRAHDILHFLPLLLCLDAKLACDSAEGQNGAFVLFRCIMLRSAVEACKICGQYQRALRLLNILDDLTAAHRDVTYLLTTPTRLLQSRGMDMDTDAARFLSKHAYRSGGLGVSAEKLQLVRLDVQLLMKNATTAELPLPSFHDALMKADAAQTTLPAVEAGEFHAASEALVLPPLLYRVGCRVRLHGLLQQQAVLNGAEGVVQSGVENKRIVVRLTRATSEATEKWKEGFRVMVDKVQCMSLFEDM